MWIVGKLILAGVLGAAIASELSRLAATRDRNARLTVSRYTAPSPWLAVAPTAAAAWISPAITFAQCEEGDWLVTES